MCDASKDFSGRLSNSRYTRIAMRNLGYGSWTFCLSTSCTRFQSTYIFVETFQQVEKAMLASNPSEEYSGKFKNSLLLPVALRQKGRAPALLSAAMQSLTPPPPNPRVHPISPLAWTADATLSPTHHPLLPPLPSYGVSPTHSTLPFSPSSIPFVALSHNHHYFSGGGGRTNDNSKEATYRLLVQRPDHPVMPLKHVGDGGRPPWSLPLRPPPAKKTNKKTKQGGGGDGDGDDGTSRMGYWEELFDAVTGTKIWYNTVTQKKTTKDPFW